MLSAQRWLIKWLAFFDAISSSSSCNVCSNIPFFDNPDENLVAKDLRNLDRLSVWTGSLFVQFRQEFRAIASGFSRSAFDSRRIASNLARNLIGG